MSWFELQHVKPERRMFLCQRPGGVRGLLCSGARAELANQMELSHPSQASPSGLSRMLQVEFLAVRAFAQTAAVV